MNADVRRHLDTVKRVRPQPVGAALIAASLALAVLSLPACAGTIGLGQTRLGAATGQERPAPNGEYVTVQGGRASIAGLHGHPVLLWFVAGGCASCAVSIPTVAGHLQQLSAMGVRVITLGLPGAFGSGSEQLSNLQQFGQAAAGPAFHDADWTWGMATMPLVKAYDPAGTPDVYFLITANGRIWYRNSVPVSTIGDLLREARAMVSAQRAGPS